MLKKLNSLNQSIAHNPMGGQGTIIKESILDASETSGKLKMLAKVTVPIGASIGNHQHIDDCEIYYILQGKGRAKDNEELVEINAGDVLYTPKGGWHALENTGDEELVFVALILP